MYGRSLLEHGIFGRVGDGKEIRIKKDKWIPEASYLPILPHVDMPDDLKVSSLIDDYSRQWNDYSRQWNEELVRICFRPADAECILNIPLSHNQVYDCLSWMHTRTGIYTVKSAYIRAKCEAIHLKSSAKAKGEPSNQVCTTKEWKSLWNIKAPPKMKIVLWRFAHNCLPTGQQLTRRKILAYNLCCHCGREETIEHAFLSCKYVDEIWRELKRCGFRRLIKYFQSPQQRVFETLAACSERDVVILVISVWHIWGARNAVRNGEPEVHPHCIVEKLLAYVDMVLLRLYVPVSPNCCDYLKPKHLEPPLEGWITVNVDAVVFRKTNHMGMGIVIRNHMGVFLAACRQGLDNINDPEFAEAVACKRRVLFA
ncbi:hypothetical protein BS78_01G258100 [Paspalum vaginatum]|nr:hypothetical protein BS78_01G258100 [Paspalum vaginatum]